jgi:hypothetical protein
MLWAACVEGLFRERLDARRFRVRIFGPMRRYADPLELDPAFGPLRVRKPVDQTKPTACVCERFRVREDPQAATPRRNTGPHSHARVASYRCMMRELERDGSVGVFASVEKLRHPEVHQLPARLGDLGVDHVMNQRMMEGVHLCRGRGASQERTSFELGEGVHQGVKVERHQLAEPSDVERGTQHGAPTKHVP